MSSARRALLPSLAATLLICVTVGPASADGPSDAEPPTRRSATVTATPQLSDGSQVDSADAAEAVEEYWTPDRVANAISADTEAPDPAGGGEHPGEEDGAPGGTPGSTPPAPPTAKSGKGADGYTETASVGKVYFTKRSNGRDYACSASALNSRSKQMVITAGHCVNEGGAKGGQWVKNWVYVPQYRDGRRPHGTFAAKEFRTFMGWIEDSSWHWDVAMVTTWPRDGHKLVNATGGHGLNWNYGRSEKVTVWGYPSNHDAGRVQWICAGTTQRHSEDNGTMKIKCGFASGSSGGPWLREFDGKSGLGYVYGTMSTFWRGTGWNGSSYFGDSVKKMFDEQGSRT